MDYDLFTRLILSTMFFATTVFMYRSTITLKEMIIKQNGRLRYLYKTVSDQSKTINILKQRIEELEKDR